MWNFLGFTAKNIFSYEEVEYTFANDICTLLVGVNHDKGKRSNGSGKSSIFEIITIGLTGSGLRDVKNADIVRNGESSGELSLFLENTFLDRTMQINWFLSTKESQKCQIFIDGEEQKQLVDINDKKKFIWQQLGVSKEDFFNYYLISKGHYKSFFESSDGDRKDIINRFSRANIIENTDPIIEADIKESEKQINALQIQISKIEGQIESLQSQVDLASIELWEINKKEVFEDLQDSLDTNKELIKLQEESLNQVKVDVSIKQSQLTQLNSDAKQINEQIQVVNKQIQKLQEEKQGFEGLIVEFEEATEATVKQLEKELATYREIQSNLNKSLAIENEDLIHTQAIINGAIECPNCHHKFTLDQKKSSIEEIKQIVIDIEQRIKEIQVKLENNNWLIVGHIEKVQNERISLKEQVEQVRLEIATITKEQQEIQANNKLWFDRQINNQVEIGRKSLAITNDNHMIANCELEIRKLLEKQKELNGEMQTCLNSKYEGVSKDVLDKISTLNISLDIYQQQIKTKEEELQSQKLWLGYFAKFYSYIANQSIIGLSNYCNFYLQKLKSELYIFIESTKTLSTKKTKEAIDIQISRDGIQKESFYKFSGGERVFLESACILAMQKLINNSSETGGVNFLGLDEILESIDEMGLREILDMLNGLEQTILNVTHVQVNNSYPNILEVHKRGGITTLQLN